MRRNISYGEEHAVTSMGRFFDAMEAKAFSLPSLQRIHNDVASAKASGLLVFPNSKKEDYAEKLQISVRLRKYRRMTGRTQKYVADCMKWPQVMVCYAERKCAHIALDRMHELEKWYLQTQGIQ